jgi:asparagine synthetase B (glutamine-hydrolysing)
MRDVASNQALLEPAAATAADRWVVRIPLSGGPLDVTGVPFVTRGPLSVFIDGVLYDRRDLAAACGLSERASDAELLIEGFARQGDRLIGKLRGAFAVVFVDRERGLATVIRDPVGSHPAFYTTVGDAILVSSSQQALLAQPGVSRRLNAAVMADHLCQRWPQVHETYFEAITRLAPGSRLIVERSKVRVERYWNKFDGPVDFLSHAEADRFDERLSVAVERCFGRGRIGVFLSGGFDSVSVAAVAADHARKSGQQDPMALSLGFPHPECDERFVQTGVARQLGLSHDLIGFMEAAGPRGLLGEGLALNERLATPLFNTWFPAYLTLARRGVQHGVGTVITGEGGDEWLNVSPYLSADLIRRGNLVGLYNLARTWHRSFNTQWFWVSWSTLWAFGLKPLVGAGVSTVSGDWWDRNRAARRVASDPAWIAPDARLKSEQARRALAKVVDARPAGGFYARELRAFVDDPLMSLFFEEQHELGREAGVRFQHPYWDADLVEHMYRTPPDVLTRGNRTKGLVRAAIDRRFPGFGFKVQRKVLAFSFFADVATQEARRLASNYTDFAALGGLGIVEPAGARAFVEGAFDSTPRTMVQAWRLVTLESWARAQLV